MTTFKTGDIVKTKEGSSCVVLENRGWDDVLVRFLDSHAYERSCRAEHLRTGRVKNPYHPTVHGVGFHGVGPHKKAQGAKTTAAFNKWRQMLTRCYDPKYQKIQPTYIGCSVHPDWHNFQNFAEWLIKQPNWNKRGWQLDKDLLIAGNKEYSSEKCVVIPQKINLLTSSRNDRDLPTGVFQEKQRSDFIAYVNDENGKREYLGRFSTAEEASEAHRAKKRIIIKKVADLYANQLPIKAYEALIALGDNY